MSGVELGAFYGIVRFVFFVAAAHVLAVDDLIIKLSTEDAEAHVQLEEAAAECRHFGVIFFVKRLGNLFAGKHL